MFKNLKIPMKLLGGFGFILTLLSGALGVYHHTIRSTVTRMGTLINVDIAIAAHAGEVEALILQYLRDEKDFPARRNMKYLGRVEENVAELLKETASIKELAGKYGLKSTKEMVLQVEAQIRTYLENFRKVVEAYEIKERIEGIQTSTQITVKDICEITSVIKDMNDMVATIATAVEEQAVTKREIAQNVAQASTGIFEVTENVSQSSQVAGDVTRDCGNK